jgi:hypothetical protein
VSSRNNRLNRGKGRPGRRAALHVFEISPRDSNEDILNQMRRARDQRGGSRGDRVVTTCCVAGFDHDPRELGEIPEARALCRRAVQLGLISWLDVSTVIPELCHPALAGLRAGAGLGAFELWAISEGLVRGAGKHAVTKETLERFRDDLKAANRRADEAIGPDE